MKNFRHFQKSNPEFMWKVTVSQPTITYSKLTIETLEQM